MSHRAATGAWADLSPPPSESALGIHFVHPGGPRFVPFRPGRSILGRNPACTIPLDGRAVSWEHAELRFDGRAAVLRDLGSTNGLQVDGASVRERELRDGTVIRVGDFLGVVGAAPAGTPAAGAFARAAQLGLHLGPMLSAALAPLALLLEARGPSRHPPGPVVVEGEAGSGKLAVARLLRAEVSDGDGADLLVVDGSRGDAAGLRRELLGPAAEPGGDGDGNSPAGALARARARAHGLYLANVTALPAPVQEALAGALADPEARRALVVGSQEPLARAFADGRLLPLLYQRLGAEPALRLELPPLRRRRVELPDLFRRLFEARGGGRCPLLGTDLVERLCLYDWPWNLRELALLCERLATLHGEELRLRAAHLPARLLDADLEKTTSPVQTVTAVDAPALLDALRAAGGDVARAAERLGISRERAYRLIDRLGRQSVAQRRTLGERQGG